MTLKYLVDNKIEFTSPVLISYIKNYPMKYIKIKIKKEKNENEQNIIDLSKQFKDTKFLFDYCFPFFGIIISKIIYMNENYFSINYKNLSGSAIGSFLEQKFKRCIIYENCLKAQINLRYVWNFSVLKECDKPLEQIDYTNFEKIEYDENIKNINLSSLLYYIVPGSQTNESLDSALLIPVSDDKTFILMTFQIKSKDYKIKEKEIYIKSSFTTKEKFENLYKIKITKVYFYFILSKEFKTNAIINDLEDKKIKYLFFSFQNKTLLKGNKEISVYELIDKDSEIIQNLDIEDENFEIKKNSIEKIESFLQKKRYKGDIITRNIFENARLLVFKRDKGLSLSNEERNNIIEKLKI